MTVVDRTSRGSVETSGGPPLREAALCNSRDRVRSTPSWIDWASRSIASATGEPGDGSRLSVAPVTTVPSAGGAEERPQAVRVAELVVERSFPPTVGARTSA